EHPPLGWIPYFQYIPSEKQTEDYNDPSRTDHGVPCIAVRNLLRIVRLGEDHKQNPLFAIVKWEKTTRYGPFPQILRNVFIGTDPLRGTRLCSITPSATESSCLEIKRDQQNTYEALNLLQNDVVFSIRKK